MQPSAISDALPIDTASAPIASAFATSAPVRMPPEMMSCTLRCMSSSSSASTASRSAGSVGNADMLDEHVLRRRRTALHAVEHDDVRARLHRERYVVARPRVAPIFT